MRTSQQSKSWHANIWIGGNYDDAVRACREYAQKARFCVSITKTAFVYVGGMGDGVCVRFMQYPRFPEPENELRNLAIDLAIHLRERLSQRSFSVEFPDDTVWDSLEIGR